MRQLRSRTRAAVVAALAPLALGAALFGANTASADDGQSLMPDPAMYCAQNTPFGTQQLEAGWIVRPDGLQGDQGQNNWKCHYEVAATLPHADLDFNTFALPAVPYTVPVDWAAMCSQQYPGSRLQYIQAPATGVFGAPWQCVGAPGRTYTPVS